VSETIRLFLGIFAILAVATVIGQVLRWRVARGQQQACGDR
jgi:predicted CDP-diglyceride synthetase/phosphatidate cytidylyltransferase